MFFFNFGNGFFLIYVKFPKVTPGIVSARFRERKLPWKRLVERLNLTKEDREGAVKWGRQWKSKKAKFWDTKVMAIDNKNFTCRTNAKGRLYSHSTRIRGAYLGRGMRMKITKPSKLKHREGQGSVNVLSGVLGGKVVLWVVIKERWNSQVYADLVKGAIRRAMKRTGATHLLRDNDPKGYQTKRGLAAEAQEAWTVLRLPVRRPDLNVLDFHVWNAILRAMAEEERTWPTTKKENKEEWAARVKATAKKLNKEHISKGMRGMVRRCAELVKTKGDWIQRDY